MNRRAPWLRWQRPPRVGERRREGPSCAASGLENYLVLLEPRQPGEPRVLAGCTDVDDQQRLQVGTREEVLVDPLGVEATHRTGGQPDGADAQQEVTDLKRGVEAGGGLAAGLVGEEVLGSGEVRERAPEMLVKGRVRGENGHQWCARGLFTVSLGHVLEEPLAGLVLSYEHDAQRL